MGFIYSQLFITPPYPLHSYAGQTIIVTGANVGLGLEAARHFASNNASKVILAVRNTEAGAAAKKSIEASSKCPVGTVEVWKLDLQSYASVKAFGARVEQELTRLDICLMNAGIATGKHKLAEGHESTITTNVISTFLLSLLVLPKMKATRQAHPNMARPTLTIVSSEVHFWTQLPARNREEGIFKALDDMTSLDDMRDRYHVSKFLDVACTRALAEHISTGADGKPLVIVDTPTPGLCHSELAREAGYALWILKMFFARSTEVGSRTLVHAASAGLIEHGSKADRVDGGLKVHGQFLNNCQVADVSDIITGKGNVQGFSGPALQQKIWSELCDLLEAIQPGVTNNA